MSPSLRGRGLKSHPSFRLQTTALSPSLRGRGLKLHQERVTGSDSHVALFTRAWIEIALIKSVITGVPSPSLRGRGLKFKNKIAVSTLEWSPSLRGRGLKFDYAFCNSISEIVALFTRAWIEMFMFIYQTPHCRVALFTRAWIEIFCCCRNT